MTDVVEIAKERQAKLAAEFNRLGDFIRMAEALVKNSQSKSSKASDTEHKQVAGGNGAEAEPRDLSVRELKAVERVLKSRTIQNEPGLNLRELFSFRETA
jgi:hypothetical protein